MMSVMLLNELLKDGNGRLMSNCYLLLSIDAGTLGTNTRDPHSRPSSMSICLMRTAIDNNLSLQSNNRVNIDTFENVIEARDFLFLHVIFCKIKVESDMLLV
jgi:hypothetical protein